MNNFTDKLNEKWGAEECQLRTAIYISFVKDSETRLFRKKIKQARTSFMRQSIMSKKSMNSKYSINSRVTIESKCASHRDLSASFTASGISNSKLRFDNEDIPMFGSTRLQKKVNKLSN
jgi:hypothetical protein